MRPAPSIWLSMGQLICAVLVASCLMASDAPAEPLLPGEPAPFFEKLEKVIAERHPEQEMKGPMVLTFVNEADSNSARVIQQLKELNTRQEELFKQARVVIVLTRVNGEMKLDPGQLPKRWTIIQDLDDSYYVEYHVIATPTIVVAGTNGKIVAFHAGYSPGLMAAVQRNLLTEIHGTEAVRTAAPPASLELQLGQRFAERQQWDRALPYYRKAAEKDALDPTAKLEMARILVEMQEFDEATALLDELKDAEGAAPLRERIGELQRTGPQYQ